MEIDYKEWCRIKSSEIEIELEIRELMIQGKEPVLLTMDGKAIQMVVYDTIEKAYKFIPVK